ncbi:MAG: glycosyltransferase family 39 protein [Planctomycetota bacterium]
MRRYHHLLALLSVLAVTIPLYAIGIDWGLPNHYSYAPDAISPLRAIDAARSYFDSDRRWADKYPPGHFYLTALVCKPFFSAVKTNPGGEEFRQATNAVIEGSKRRGWARVENQVEYLKTFANFRPQMTVLILAGRLITLVMGVLAVVFLYLIGRALRGVIAGLSAALIAASYSPMVYHAHTMNVDVPYVFWLMVAFWSLVCALRSGRTLAFIVTGAAGAMAVATKDQAYGVLLAAPLLFLICWWRPASLGLEASGHRSFPVRGVALALLSFVVVFVVANNLLFNWEGFRDHLHYIRTEGVEPFRQQDATPKGHVFLLLQAAGLVFTTMPWLGVPHIGAVPLAVGAAIGLVRRPAPTVFALLPALTFYCSFIAVIGYCYSRFLIPVIFFLALPAGYLIQDFTAIRRARGWLGAAAGILVVVPLIASGATILRAFLDDPRERATAWLAEHLEPGDKVLIYADYLFTAPRLPDGTDFEVVTLRQYPGGQADLEVVGRGGPEVLTSMPIAYVIVSSFHPILLQEAPVVGDEKAIFGRTVRVAAVFLRSFDHPVLDQIRVNPTVVIYRLEE